MITQGLTKVFKFQLVFWASSSDISLARRHFLLVSVYDLIRGWFSWTLAHWRSKLEKLVTYPERQSTEPCHMKERFHLYVHTTEFCPEFKTESIRKLSNYNFQWTKTLYDILHMKFSEFYLCFHDSCKIWHLFSRAPMRNCLWCYRR